MKKQTNNSLRLGIFVVLGLVLLSVAIYTLGRKKNLFGSSFRLYAVFNDVQGLMVGNNVRFSGINVGTVEEIAILTDTSVQVSMRIESDTRPFIKSDARAQIGTDGLMGNKVISLLPGTVTNAPIEPEANIATSKPFDMNGIMQSLKNMSENAEIITRDLSMISHSVSSGEGTVGRFFMDKQMADDMSETMKNLAQCKCRPRSEYGSG